MSKLRNSLIIKLLLVMIFVNLWIINKLRYMKQQNSDVSDLDDDSDLED